MKYSRIEKRPLDMRPTPNMLDYEAARASFSWQAAARALSGLPYGRGLNIAHEAVDRHVYAGRGAQLAIRWVGSNGSRRDITHSELAKLTHHFASGLRSLGIGAGERVFCLLGRVPELHVAALGSLKHRAVFCPLSTGLGPEPVQTRLRRGRARVLVTTPALYVNEVRAARAALPDLAHVILVGPRSLEIAAEEAVWLDELLAKNGERYDIQPTPPSAPALLHFTSSTTGHPKGVLHPHEAVLAHHATGSLALDLHPGDVLWCTEDPGWITSTTYGIISPLVNGATTLVNESEPDAVQCYEALEREGVNVWYTTPTTIRKLIEAGPELPGRYDLRALRLIASFGEPLGAQAVSFSRRVLGRTVHEGWSQTEAGGIMIGNFACMPIKPGSMGRPLPGVEAAIVRRTSSSTVEVVEKPGMIGQLALARRGPYMFCGHIDDGQSEEQCFSGEWYLTGDLASRDADGYYWFFGRTVDVIESAGHRVAPLEVERGLAEHWAVAEAGVVGKADPITGELVKAFVVLRPGPIPGRALQAELLEFARARLGPALAPRELTFVSALPRTRSGRVMRRVLKAQETGTAREQLALANG